MKYGIIFLITSLILFFASKSLVLLKVVLIWLAFSFLIISIGYLGLGASVFGKKNGRLSFLNYLLLFPYHILNMIVWHLVCKLSTEPRYHVVNDNIIIGRRLLNHEIDFKVDYYIDLTSEFSEARKALSDFEYINLQILDAEIPKVSEVKALLSEISGKSVYIHCAQGHGRTGLVAGLLLLNDGVVSTLEEAMATLKNVRPELRLNRKQKIFIEKYLVSKT